MTNNRVFGLAALLGSGLLVACGGGSKPAPPPTTAPASTSAAASVAAGDFGVPECDEFMKKYLACIDSKVPEAGRAMMKTAFDQQKAAWKQAAATPEGKAGLVTACNAMSEQTKATVAAYGCTW